jgi:homoaconitase/3-isopropylmalate dehydratase large subunit
MGQRQAEKILARAAGRESVMPGDHVVREVDRAMAHDLGALGVSYQMHQRDIDEVWDPSKIAVPLDHVAPSHDVEDANRKSRIREFVDEHGIEDFFDVGRGISHEVLPEEGLVRPGELVLGTDSHTTTLWAFGAAGTGIGTTGESLEFGPLPDAIREIFDAGGLLEHYEQHPKGLG